MAESDENGKPVRERLQWNGDTPHPTRHENDQYTCETLWPADTHTGDYHDNMNSNLFLQWVEERLIPSFKAIYPGHKMCLVLDNAPYHHLRPVGSLQSVSKKELLNMMEDDGVETIELLWNDSRWDQYSLGDNSIVDRGEYMEIEFQKEEQAMRASATKARVGTRRELQMAYLKWLKNNKPEKLQCKFETRMKEEGYRILWTPPYCPKVQPIEVFWANGKNHVADMYDINTTLKDVVNRLQDGWYGNDDHLPTTDIEYTRGTTCEGLVKKAIDAMDKEFIPLCPGIQGQIGRLTVDETHVRDTSEIPIDSFVIDLTKGLDLEEE